MDVRARAIARTARQADRLALGDIRVAGDLDPALMAVGGREAVVVVDDHEVPVARLPAAPDDRPGRGGVNRSTRRDADVDPRVEAPPARAEGARDRPGDGPDEPRRARGCRGPVAGLGGLDLGLESRARRLDRIRLGDVRSLLRLRPNEEARLARGGAGELVLARHELADEVRLLLHARVDRALLLLHALPRLRRLDSRNLDLPLRGRDLGGDALVLRGDRAEVVDLVEHVLEALRRQQQIDRRRRALLVD